MLSVLLPADENVLYSDVRFNGRKPAPETYVTKELPMLVAAMAAVKDSPMAQGTIDTFLVSAAPPPPLSVAMNAVWFVASPIRN